MKKLLTKSDQFDHCTIFLQRIAIRETKKIRCQCEVIAFFSHIKYVLICFHNEKLRLFEFVRMQVQMLYGHNSNQFMSIPSLSRYYFPLSLKCLDMHFLIKCRFLKMFKVLFMYRICGLRHDQTPRNS